MYTDTLRFLEDLVSTEKPSEEYIEKGCQFINNIFCIIQRDTKKQYSWQKFVIFGSIGEDTAVSERYLPNFDCAFFINEEEPPYDKKVILTIQNVLEKAISNRELENIQVNSATNNSLKLIFRNISVSIFLATNFIPQNKNDCVANNLKSVTDETSLKNQVQNVKCRMRTLPNPGKQYKHFRSSLCELSVLFVKRQSEFARNVVRLAKLWYQRIPIQSEKNSEKTEVVVYEGRSYLIELIAIHVARRENQTRSAKRGKKNLFLAFKKFLRDIGNFQNLQVYFKDYYTILDIPQNVFSQIPLVLDPVLPFNNLAYEIDPKFVEILEINANLSLEKINHDCNDLCIQGLHEIFQIQ